MNKNRHMKKQAFLPAEEADGTNGENNQTLA